MTPHFLKNKASTVATGLVIAAVMIILWAYLFETVVGRRESQRQVRHLVESLLLGSPTDTVEALVRRSEYERLSLGKLDSARWLVETPSIPGARNWVVWLEFDQEKLSRVRVRTADSVNEVPSGAPADKTLH